MASEIDWGSVGGKGQGGGSGRNNFIRFESGKSYSVRPIGGGVQFAKMFDRVAKRSVVTDLEFGDRAAELLSAHSGREIKAQKRYGINVIDREDGKVKILEGGQQIFKYFGTWVKNNGDTPVGGIQGGNWSIDVEGEGLNRSYTTGFMGVAALTQDEIKRIKDQGEIYSLKEVFKSIPIEEVVDKMYGNRDQSPSNAGGDLPKAAPAEAAAAAVGTDADLPW